MSWSLKTVWAALNGRTFTPRDPELARLLGGGGETHAKKVVTVDTALNLSTVWACVRLIAETVATLPLVVWEDGGNGRRPARSHPLWTLLRDAPNADMTGPEFWEAMLGCLYLWGNAYAEISRGYANAAVALTPLRPDQVTVARRGDGALEYRFHDPRGPVRVMDERDVLHLKGFSLDGLTGLSPVGQARHSMGLALAADEAAGKTFANGMRIGGYIKMPAGQALNDAQRPKAYELLNRFKGSANTGEVPILEGGWEYVPSTMPPAEAELLLTRQFSVEEICRWYRTPPHMVGHMDKSTSWGTGLEQQMLGFLTLTLRPVLKKTEAAVKRRLVPPNERGTIEPEFNVEGLLRADSAGRATFLGSMVREGIYTRNEARAYENKPPKPGLADELTVQSQNVPISLKNPDALAAEPPAPAPARAPAGPRGPATRAREDAE